MRTLAFILTLAAAAPLSASVLWFDPPNPTSRTPVTAHFSGSWQGCGPRNGNAMRSGTSIFVSFDFTVCPPADPTDATVDLGLIPAGVYDVTVGITPPNVAVGLGDAQLTVTDSDAAFTIEPNVAGPDPVDSLPVTLSGSAIAPICAVAPCPLPIVTFGGAQATVTEVRDTNTIVVQPPEHAPGIVDVVVSFADHTQRATAAFDYPDPAKPFDTTFFEPVLFPVMISGPGAFGSIWSTEVTLRNENDYTLPVSSIFDATCLFECFVLAPGPHSTVLVSGLNRPNGYLLYAPRQAAPNLSFGTLARDMSRQAQTLGTEIPVVREKDFHGRPFSLLNIPTDARYRVALRFYRIDDTFDVHFTIWTMDSSSSAPLVDTYAFLARPDPTSPLSYQTAYIGDLVATYPQLAGKGPLRIEIDPASAQRATWAFVSVTNNDTQDVTVISPH